MCYDQKQSKEAPFWQQQSSERSFFFSLILTATLLTGHIFKASAVENSLVLNAPSSPPQPSNNSSRGKGITESRVEELVQQWNVAYGLDSPHASGDVVVHENTTRAPHLRNCHQQAQKALQDDARGPNGELPMWMGANGKQNITVADIMEGRVHPQPPWVEGADTENADLTRRAQAALWLHQHPVNCSDPSLQFFLVDWWGLGAHGIGSQVNGITATFAFGLHFHRVFVVSPSFKRAAHRGCIGDHQKRLDCYYLPLVPAECTRRAMETNNGTKPHKVGTDDGRPVWYYGASYGTYFKKFCPKDFCKGRLKDETDESLGQIQNYEIGWWRAQAARYLLRAPSEYLCRLENIARHQTLSQGVARQIIESRKRQEELYRQAEEDGGNLLQAMVQGAGHLWGEGAYLPRPLIHMHIRGGAKKREMTLWSLRAFMEQAERIRRHDPSARSIWVSTMFESVLQELPMYRDWAFYFTDMPRLPTKLESAQIDDLPDPRQPKSAPWGDKFRTGIDQSFINLEIAAQCDYFIGTLGSNWDRLINALRKTNGRLNRGYLSFNTGMW
eukprot:TRINITY_DN17707_c0_g1_i1.p1 TRINITY_DN17707_c0_g1~~TRINITY_DN17707_c0_g1_i1.p1  ORF type:complete len:557 (+),score=81.92 TRINITY_DN17707_c0_g1_i1:371-2041(+)